MWSAWWALNNATSFDGGLSDSYDGEFFEFWSEQLAHKPARLVDLCCGNGSITWIANTICNDPAASTRITGIDFSDIKPFKRTKRKPDDFPLVDFIGNTLVEALPMEDKSVDMIISQYGIEYSDLTLAVPEMSRVLKDNARVVFLMHCDWSAIALESQATKLRYDYLLEEGQFHPILFELDALYNAKRSYDALQNDPLFNKLHAKLNVTLYAAKNLKHQGVPLPESTSVSGYLSHYVGLFGNPAKFKDRKRKAAITGGMKNVVETCQRQADLLGAAMSKDHFQEMVKLLELEGFQLSQSNDFYYNGILYGVVLVAERAC
jgi:ubiquinone/menaquinone biosynthesis C-methylase UbiE